MSRLDGREVIVWGNGEHAAPQTILLPDQVEPAPVLRVREHWREWFDVLDGGVERDVWQVELDGHGWCELHHLRTMTSGFGIGEEGFFSNASIEERETGGTWVLARWED